MPSTGSVRWALFDSDSHGAIGVRLTQIRDFLTVVESGSIRAAARKLGVSQPTITRFMQGRDIRLSRAEKIAVHLGLEVTLRTGKASRASKPKKLYSEADLGIVKDDKLT